MTSELMLAFLQRQAVVRTLDLGHKQGAWVSAKHKYGKAAKTSQCVLCGATVVLTPYGNPKGPKVARDAPSIAGDALFTKCVTTIPQRKEGDDARP